MKILSLFDGISCGMLALKKAGINVEKYYSSEIDKYAIQVSENNFPEIERLGDVNNWRNWNIEKIDMIIGGSPCQGFSFAGKQLAFDDPRSKLFFTMVDIIRHHKPKYFLLENVKMKKEFQDIISEYLGVQPIEINSSLVSAQNRKRLYWTNIQGTEQPKDKGIVLKDILQDVVEEKYYLSEKMLAFLKHHKKQQPEKGNGFGYDVLDGKNKAKTIRANAALCPTDNIIFQKPIRFGHFNLGGQGDRVYLQEGKSVALSALGGGRGAKTGLYKVGNTNPSGRGMNGTIHSDEGKSPAVTTNKGEGRKILQRSHGFNSGGIHEEKSPTLTTCSFEQNNHVIDDFCIRKLTPIECERLQTVPDNYTAGISDSQRYKCLGNGWTVDVIAHIFGYIGKEVNKVYDSIDL